MFAKSKMDYEAIPLPDKVSQSPEDSLASARAFHDAMKTRHSVRDFSDQPVDRAVIEWAIRTAGTAPSGANHQPWHFVAVSNADTKHKIRLAAEEVVVEAVFLVELLDVETLELLQ